MGSTVTSTTYTLKIGTTNVPGTVTLSTVDGKTATFTPSSPLGASTIYTATVKGGSTGVTDLAGNFMTQDYSWTFTTADCSFRHDSTNSGNYQSGWWIYRCSN